MRQVRDARREFVAAAGNCWACRTAPATDCHEMANGPHRELALRERCAWLALCNACNCHRMTDRRIYPLARQLALKWIYDREHFALEQFNALRGRAPGAITFDEVVLWVCWELDAKR